MASKNTFSEYANFDALGLAELVNSGEVSSEELVTSAIENIERRNPHLNAVILTQFDQALAAAKRVKRGNTFSGVPYLVKDMVTSWEGHPMTWSCPYLKDLRAPSDMEFTSRLRKSGLIPLGNTHVPELGWSLSSESAMYGITRNPWAEGITAGGSSGGSAVAVASRMVPIADASDAAGSIRVPASNNGLVGLKPSRGRITFGPDQADFFYGGAQILCVSKTVRDTAAYLDVVAGNLPGDPYTLPTPEESYLSMCKKPPKVLKIGFSKCNVDGSAVHADVARAVDHTANSLKQFGHIVEEHDLIFDFDTMWKAYCNVVAVQTAGVFELWANLIGRPVTEVEISPTNWSLLSLGRMITGIEHGADIEIMRGFSREIATHVSKYAVFLCPTLNTPPKPLGSWNMSEPDIHKYNKNMGKDCNFTAPFNVSGLPAISLPMYWNLDGLPIGVQVVGSHGDESTLLQLANQLELQEMWYNKCPPTY